MTHLHVAPLALAVGALVGTVAGGLAAAAGSATGQREIRRRWAAPALAVGAIAGVGIGARFGTSVELAAYLLLVAVALPLSAIDLAVRKVPDRILLPAIPLAVMLLTVAASRVGDFGSLGRAVLAGAVSFLAYLVLALVTGQLGFGDCKAAGICGIFLGYLGWNAAVCGVLAAFLLAAVVAVGWKAKSAATPDKTLAFAPYIFMGALVAIVIS